MDTPGDPFAPGTAPRPEPRGRRAAGQLGDWTVYDVRRGGMGEVFLCGKPSLGPGPKVALKTFQKQFFLKRTVRSAFLREATIWARLSCLPGIVPVFGLERIEGRPFVLMPAFSSIDGDATLRGRIRRGPLEPEEAYRFAFQIANALFMASVDIPGLVHGDLKPENVLLPNPEQALVADFGLARAAGMDELTALATTSAYRAPECWDGADLTVSSDIYAFGVLLYELVCGNRPLRASTGDGWRKVHTRERPPRPRLAKTMGSALLDLALCCLEKAPGRRPADFREVATKLDRIGKQHDPALAQQTFMGIVASLAVLEEAQGRLKTRIVEMLLEIDEPQLALDELRRIPDDQMSARLWSLRGTASSLVDRDDEALVCFARGLELETDPTQRLLIECERGLSLKRLERHDEAIRLFERLLPAVDDQHLSNVVVNLATALLEAGRPREAMEHLARFTRRQPGNGQAWADLGLAYEQLGQYQDAVRCYERALHEAPHLTQVLVFHARVCMDHLGAIQQAWKSLEVAFDSGAASQELFSRMLACMLLRGDMGNQSALRSSLRRDLPPKEAEMIEREATEIFIRIAERLTSGAAPSPAAQAPSGAPASMKLDSTSEPTTPHEPEAAASTPDELGQATPAQGTGFTLPFVNVRYAADEGFHAIDYYDDVKDADYVHRLKNAFRQVTRSPAFQMGSSELSTHPLYFTRCDGCAFVILTNRAQGSRLACRACGHRAPTEGVADPTGSLLETIRAELGVSVKTTERAMVWLLVQETTSGQLGRAEAILTAQGYTAVSLDLPIAQLMLSRAERAGFQGGEGTKAFRAVLASTTALEGQTPVEVEQLIRQLRREVGALYTVSSVTPIKGGGFVDLIYQGRFEEAEFGIRRALADNPVDRDSLTLLAIVLRHQGELEEAARRAQQVVDLDRENIGGWLLLANVLLDLGRHREVIEYLDRIRSLDPVDVSLLLGLLSAHHALGHDAEVATLAALIRSLGGPKAG